MNRLMMSKRLNNKLAGGLLALGVILLLAAGLILTLPVMAQEQGPVDEAAQPAPVRSPFHPAYALLDEDGSSVEHGNFVSHVSGECRSGAGYVNR